MTAVHHVADTTPYPWPWDGCLRGEALALLVCGWSRGWAEVTHDVAAVTDRVDALAGAVGDAGGLVLTVVPGQPSPTRGVPPGAPLPLDGAAVVTAAGVDGFWGSDLDARLRRTGRTQLLLAGLGLEGPIHSTMRTANDMGHEALLVIDACAAGDPTTAAAARSSVEMSGGIFGAVGTTDAVHQALKAIPPTPPRRTP